MRRANIFKIIAAVVLGLTAIFWLFKGITDILGGVSGANQNLFLSIVLFGLTFLSWVRPLLGGIFTAVLAVLLAVYFNLRLPNIYIAYIPMILLCAPMVLSGFLFH